MSREYEIIKRKLICEINQNIDKIKVLRAKRNIVHCNRLDSKIISFMGMSFLTELVILPIGFYSIMNLNNFIFPYKILPYLSLGVSGIGGIILEKILVNKIKFKSNLEKFSRSKTEIEKITEELNYRLEEEKLLNYNKVLEKVMSDKALSDKLSGQDKYVTVLNGLKLL